MPVTNFFAHIAAIPFEGCLNITVKKDGEQLTTSVLLQNDGCGVLPANVLHIDPSANGSLVWYTKPQRQKLYFAESLGLNNGRVALPALVWKATKKELQLFALKGKTKPKAETPLYHAPFFNLYQKGNVCMGTVNVAIKSAATLEEFISAWQGYFFGSYFSHHINEHNPVGVNLFNLYKELMVDPEKPFPTDTLRTTPLILRNLL